MKTINFIIRIISDYLNNRETDIPKELIDWDKVIKVFKKHELAGILYYQCRNYISDNDNNTIKRLSASAMYYYGNRIWLENRIRKALDEKKINYFFVKGSALAEFYPNPSDRTMGDTDIVIHPEDRKKVDGILISLGIKNIHKIEIGDWQYHYNNMEIELHDHLIYKIQNDDNKYYEFFNNCWEYERKGVLDWSFHFLFILYHIRKHFMNQGVGFRHFVDVAILTKYNKMLNWSWIKNKLIELNMWEFAQRVFFLNKYWFGITVPLDISNYDKTFFQQATRQIFYNGIFGYDNSENNGNFAINNINRANKQGYGIRRMFSLLFPRYEIMSKFDYCKFMKGHRWMLPAAWAYRGVRVLKGKRLLKALKGAASSSFVSKSKVKERTKILEEWGLR